MSNRTGPFYIFEIAEALARLPGRLETDPDEARRIGADIYRAYQEGDFEETDVLAKTADDPPNFVPLATLKAKAGRDWQDPAATLVARTERADGTIRETTLWYRAFALSDRAVRRYVADCGLLGAQRILDEWFGAPQSATKKLRTVRPVRPGFKTSQGRRKRGPPPTTRNRVEQEMRADITAGRFSCDDLTEMKQEALARQYRVSRETACKARNKILSEFSSQKRRQTPTN